MAEALRALPCLLPTISDNQEASVTGVAAEFPRSPRRYCANQFADLGSPFVHAGSLSSPELRRFGWPASSRTSQEIRTIADVILPFPATLIIFSHVVMNVQDDFSFVLLHLPVTHRLPPMSRTADRGQP
jgi:hypothetical protein